MTGWNLPPGVSERDLPGNEPEDPIAEDIYHILFEALPQEMESLEVTFNKVMDCVERARSTAYLDGGRDEAYAASLRREQGDPS
jgi:hypothetical protein